MVVFEKVKTKAVWAALDARDRRRAALLWEFCARERPIDDLLARTERFSVANEATQLGEWWQYDESGLLFDDGHAVVGEAVQGGFVCRDSTLWEAISTSRSAPDGIHWELGED